MLSISQLHKEIEKRESKKIKTYQNVLEKWYERIKLESNRKENRKSRQYFGIGTEIKWIYLNYKKDIEFIKLAWGVNNVLPINLFNLIFLFNLISSLLINNIPSLT